MPTLSFLAALLAFGSRQTLGSLSVFVPVWALRAAAPRVGRCLVFFLGVFLVLFFSRFLRCSSLPLRVCWSLLLSPFGWVLSCFVPVVLAVAFTVLLAWSLVVAVGRLVLRLAFVRFPRPSSVPSAAWAVARACRSAGVVPRGWCCCPASALSSVRSRCFVWAVLPAVVSRRTGVVSFFWVWVGLSPSHT